MLLLLLPVPWTGAVEDEVLPLVAGTVVPNEEDVLLVDRELELWLGLGIVRPVLNSCLVLDDKEFELPVPYPVGIGKGGMLPVP